MKKIVIEFQIKLFNIVLILLIKLCIFCIGEMDKIQDSGNGTKPKVTPDENVDTSNKGKNVCLARTFVIINTSELRLTIEIFRNLSHGIFVKTRGVCRGVP